VETGPAGVDIDLGNKVKSQLPQLLASTHCRGVLGKVGGFGGLFALDTRKYREPVLVSSVDGVGTKLKISGLAAATAGLNSKGAEFLAADLKTIGLDVTLDVYPGMPQLLQSVLNPAKFDLLLHVTNGNGVDPTSYGQLWSSGIAAGGGNYASIKDPQIDALVAAQDKEVDATKRKALVRQLEDYLYDNAILAPLAQPKIFKGRSAKLKGANVYHGSQKWVNWQRVWFDQ